MGWKQGHTVTCCGLARQWELSRDALGSATAPHLPMQSLIAFSWRWSCCVCRVLLSVLGCEPSLFQVIYRALSPANKIEDPYSPEAQDLLKLTNLRLLLLKRQECPCHGSGLVEKPQRFAHYAIYDLIIRGSCFCNGHAEECELANRTGVTENMVSARHLSAYYTYYLLLLPQPKCIFYV